MKKQKTKSYRSIDYDFKYAPTATVHLHPTKMSRILTAIRIVFNSIFQFTFTVNQKRSLFIIHSEIVTSSLHVHVLNSD